MRLGAMSVVLLVVLAGCSGMGGGVNGTGEGGTATETATPTATPTATVAPPDGEIVAFGDLGSTEQEAFLEAVDGGSVRFVPGDLEGYSYSVVYDFRCVDYVRYEGRYYEVDVNRGRLYKSKTFELGEATNVSSDAAIRDYRNLSEIEQERVQDALVGEYTTGYGEGDGVFGVDYIRHQNQTYRVVRTRIADGPSYSMIVERYEPGRVGPEDTC
jgi:hypothetical protein